MKLYKIVFLSLLSLVSVTNWAESDSLRSQLTHAKSAEQVRGIIKIIESQLKYLKMLSEKANDKLKEFNRAKNQCDEMVAAAIKQRNKVCKSKVEDLRCTRDPQCGKGQDDYAEYEAEVSLISCIDNRSIGKGLSEKGCFWDKTAN